MTKAKPKKRYATLKFRNNPYNGRLISVAENAVEYPLFDAGGFYKSIVLAELVEGDDKGEIVAVRLSNFKWCES